MKEGLPLGTERINEAVKAVFLRRNTEDGSCGNKRHSRRRWETLPERVAVWFSHFHRGLKLSLTKQKQTFPVSAHKN